MPTSITMCETFEEHPLDFDWRFSLGRGTTLADALSAFSRPLLLGTPTVAWHLQNRTRNVLLIDRQPLYSKIITQQVVADLCGPDPVAAPGPFDIVLVDPPWYPDHAARWINAALRITRHRAPIWIAAWTAATRPSGGKEFHDLLCALRSIGRVEIDSLALVYDTPGFERPTLDAPTGRRGTLVRFHPNPSAETMLPEATLASIATWRRFNFGARQIAIRVGVNAPARTPPTTLGPVYPSGEWLRYRNTVPDANCTTVDGAAEHAAVLAARQFVWWGWWKRANEPDRAEDIRTLPLPCSVTIVSPSERLQFTARISEVRIGAIQDLEGIPAYYRARAADIPVWFRIVRFEPTAFDDTLGRLTSRSVATLFTPDDIRGLENAQRAIKFIELPASTILQVSDIHLGADHAFLRPGEKPINSPDPSTASTLLSLPNAIANDLKRLGSPTVGALLVSGDIVSKSEWDLDLVLRFFEELMDRLDVKPDRLLMVPGNHDFYRQQIELTQVAVNYQHELPFRTLRSQLLSTRALEPLEQLVHLEAPSVDYYISLALLDSARWNAFPGFGDFGFVGRDKYQPVLENLASSDRFSRVRCVALHHHLVPIQPVEQPGSKPTRPVSVTLDAADLLTEMQAAGVSVVMHGHQHRPDAVKVARYRKEPAAKGFKASDQNYLGILIGSVI